MKQGCHLGTDNDNNGRMGSRRDSSLPRSHRRGWIVLANHCNARLDKFSSARALTNRIRYERPPSSGPPLSFYIAHTRGAGIQGFIRLVRMRAAVRLPWAVALCHRQLSRYATDNCRAMPQTTVALCHRQLKTCGSLLNQIQPEEASPKRCVESLKRRPNRRNRYNREADRPQSLPAQKVLTLP
jgi:hypothetical protein